MNKIMAFIIGALGLVAAMLGMDRKRVKAERDRETQRADVAETRADYHEEIDQAMAELEKQQREETIDVNKKINTGDRRQLDSDW